MRDVVDMTNGVYRRVYAGYITGHKINSLSLEAEAWFWRLNAVADDYGNMRAEPSLLVARTMGLRQIKPERVMALVDEILAAGLVTRYAVGKDQYLHIVGFEARQPCGRNGRRIKYHPLHPNASECIPVNPGESGGIQNNPVAPIPIPIPNPIPTPTREEPPSGGGVVSNSGGEAKPRPTGADLPGFDEFWKAYPRRVAKQDALKAWKKQDCDEHAHKILAQIKRYKRTEDWKKDGGKFIPYPASWLNGRRWEDDPPEAPLHPLARRVTYEDFLKLEASFGQGPAIEPPSRAFKAQTIPEGGSNIQTQQGGSNGQ